MAKFKKGILGPVSGKIGPVVGASWKGISYLRAAPKKKKGAKRSPAQLENQQKFKFLNQFLTPFHPYLNNGFRHNASKKTEINAGFTANYRLVSGTYPDLVIDLTQLALSKGDLATLKDAVLVWLNDNRLQLSWNNLPERNAGFDDQLMFIIYAPGLEKADGVVGGTRRSAGEFIFTLEEQFMHQELFVYAAMLALNGRSTSDSIYLGRMVSP